MICSDVTAKLWVCWTSVVVVVVVVVVSRGEEGDEKQEVVWNSNKDV